LQLIPGLSAKSKDLLKVTDGCENIGINLSIELESRNLLKVESRELDFR